MNYDITKAVAIAIDVRRLLLYKNVTVVDIVHWTIVISLLAWFEPVILLPIAKYLVRKHTS